MAAGQSAVEIAHRLGHSRPSITLDIYSHRVRREEELAEVVDELLG